jgi:hypothetical protein
MLRTFLLTLLLACAGTARAGETGTAALEQHVRGLVETSMKGDLAAFTAIAEPLLPTRELAAKVMKDPAGKGWAAVEVHNQILRTKPDFKSYKSVLSLEKVTATHDADINPEVTINDIPVAEHLQDGVRWYKAQAALLMKPPKPKPGEEPAKPKPGEIGFVHFVELDGRWYWFPEVDKLLEALAKK